MYEVGDTLFLYSDRISGKELPRLDVKAVDNFFQSHRTGNRATLDVTDGHLNAHRLIYRAEIVHAYTPFTMAVVCRVRLTAVFDSAADIAAHIPLPFEEEEGQNPGGVNFAAAPITGDLTDFPEYVLKLYDRRCFANDREEADESQQYPREQAVAYHKYKQGPPVEVSRWFSDMPGLGMHGEEHDLGLFEAWLEESAKQTRLHEVSVYEALADEQGQTVPRLLDTVSCNMAYKFGIEPPVPNDLNDEARAGPDELDPNAKPFVDWNVVRGVLIEYVPSVSLRSFVHAVLEKAFDNRPDLFKEIVSVADEAVSVVLKIGQYPVLNRDVRLDNMLVRQSYVDRLGLHSPLTSTHQPIRHAGDGGTTVGDQSTPSPSRCVLIDFGHARVRFPDENDEQWRCTKQLEREEGCMAGWLKQEMNVVIKSLPGKPVGLEHQDASEGSSASLAHSVSRPPAGAWQWEGPLWSWERRNVWYRKLSPEEQTEYEKDLYWGHHPDHWK